MQCHTILRYYTRLHYTVFVDTEEIFSLLLVLLLISYGTVGGMTWHGMAWCGNSDGNGNGDGMAWCDARNITECSKI